MLLMGKIYPREGIRETATLVREEHDTGVEFISTSHDVARADPDRVLGVIAAPIRVFKELAEIIQVQSSTESVPSRESERGIRPARSSFSRISKAQR